MTVSRYLFSVVVLCVSFEILWECAYRVYVAGVLCLDYVVLLNVFATGIFMVIEYSPR